MQDIVESALCDHREGQPPGEVEYVSVAVVGVGAVGAGRLTGVGRRLRDDAFVGQVPDDVDAVGVDLPGEETTVEGWEPAAWHVVERLDRADRGEAVRLGPEGTDRLRRFAGDELDRYDALVLAVDGTDRAAVSVAADLAAAFRGGLHGPTFVVPTFPAEDPPPDLVDPETGWLADSRSQFGPDAVVPVEHGRASELPPVPGAPTDGSTTGAAPDGTGPTTTASDRPVVERVAEAVTASLAEALGTRTQFGTLAGDLHHLRGRVTVHVGRRHHPEGSIDAEALVEEAIARPLSEPPADWESGGAWLAHLRTPCPADGLVEAVPERVGAVLAGRTGVPAAERPAGLESYRLTATDTNALFLFRVEGVDRGRVPPEPENALDDDETLAEFLEGRPTAQDYDEVADFGTGTDEGADDDRFDGGLDVVR